MRRLLIALIATIFPGISLGEPIQIPGPNGPLEAEAVLPDGARDIVIIIPGSGPINRDGNAPQMGLSSDVYKHLATDLAEDGIGSFRIDKRGFFGSARAIADPNDVTIEAYEDDVLGWIERARDQASCVWLAGHSEGGLVALVAAVQRPDALCGVILLAAPGRPLGRIMIEQFAANPAAGPLMPELKRTIGDLEAGQTTDPSEIDATIRPLFSEGLQRYMINLFSFDPPEVAVGWTGPTLILQGDADFQIGTKDADMLLKAMPQAKRVTLRGGKHLLKQDVTGNPFATYQNADLPLHPDLIPAIVSFIGSKS